MIIKIKNNSKIICSKNNNYFPDTTSYLRSFADVEENIVTEIDPDAADRQGKNWKLQDQIYQQLKSDLPATQ